MSSVNLVPFDFDCHSPPPSLFPLSRVICLCEVVIKLAPSVRTLQFAEFEKEVAERYHESRIGIAVISRFQYFALWLGESHVADTHADYNKGCVVFVDSTALVI